MYGILSSWLKLWLFCSTIICGIDVAFIILRPDSLRDGCLSKYFSLWHIYADVDLRYADTWDPVTQVTSWLMLFELALNVFSLISDLFRPAHFHALMAAFTSSALVFWKTTIFLGLYLVPEIYGGHRQIAPGTPFWMETLVFWLPNSVWVFLPLMAICCLWKKVHDGWIRKDALEKHADQEIEAIFCNGGRRCCFGPLKFYKNLENGSGIHGQDDALENGHLMPELQLTITK